MNVFSRYLLGVCDKHLEDVARLLSEGGHDADTKKTEMACALKMMLEEQEALHGTLDEFAVPRDAYIGLGALQGTLLARIKWLGKKAATQTSH